MRIGSIPAVRIPPRNHYEERWRKRRDGEREKEREREREREREIESETREGEEEIGSYVQQYKALVYNMC